MWHIGDWGRASEHIGGRWEVVATQLAQERLGRGERLLLLGSHADVLGSGLPHPDALWASASEGRLALEPLDFKWSLETASARQVATETLARLLEAKVAHLEAELAAARRALGLPPDAPVEPREGRFLAPQHPANRAALRDDPYLPSTLLPVDPRAFFQPLPGWPAAVGLARIEGVDLDRVAGIEAVERYYRLGAGVTGALTRLRTGLFEEAPAPVDAAAEVAILRERGPARTLNALLLDLERALATRRAQEEQLAALARTAYPFARLRADLARLRVPRAVLDSRGRLGRAHGEVLRALSQAIRVAGRELVRSGVRELDALARLADQSDHWAALGARYARDAAARLRQEAAAPTRTA